MKAQNIAELLAVDVDEEYETTTTEHGTFRGPPLVALEFVGHGIVQLTPVQALEVANALTSATHRSLGQHNVDRGKLLGD